MEGAFSFVLLFLVKLATAIYNPVQQHDSFIGFTAFAPEILTYDAFEQIRFTETLLNEGGHYSILTGNFTCPVDGVYFISVGIVRNGNSALGNINVNVGEITVMTVNSGGTNNYATHANTVVYTCSEGDQIFLRNDNVNSASLFGDPIVARSTFTVMLLAEGDPLQQSKHSNLTALSVGKLLGGVYVGGDTIVYETELFNTGGAYFPAINRFVCPQSGIYFVNIASRKNGSNAMHIVVRKETHAFLELEDLNTDNSNNFVTNNGLIPCDANEVITVQATGDGGISGRDPPYSTYTIFLVSPPTAAVAGSMHTEAVGISAYKQLTQTYAGADVIPFEGFLYNSGGDYQRPLNRFICPFTGVYYITLNAKKQGNAVLNVFVELNGLPVFQLEDATSNNNGIYASNSALIEAEAGDAIQVTAGADGSVNGDNVPKTTFTILLMHEK